MKARLIFILLAFTNAVFAGDDLAIENGEPYKKENVKPFLDQLHSENDYVLTFRATSPWKADTEYNYFILTKKGTKLTTYTYSDKSRQLATLNLSDEARDLIWRAYVSNELFAIETEKENLNFCPEKYDVFYSHTYEFILLSKENMKKLTYYDPEHYDKFCPGIVERQKVINCASVVSYVLSKL